MTTSPDAEQALAEFRATLHEVIELLTTHRLYRWVGGLTDLGAHAEQQPGRTPAQTLADLDREWTRFITIPDGFSAVYIQDDTGVDRAATRRLDALRDRLMQALRAGKATP